MKTFSQWGRAIAVAAAFVMFAVPASAQDDDTGPITQGEDAKYISITHIKFKPGKREGAMQIIGEHFGPAAEKAGLPGPILAIHYQTGEWDLTAVWEMEGGMADLEWYRSPDNVKWFAALAEQEGGAEQAAALLDEYRGMIDEAHSEVGHYHTGEEAE
jgi:hypothetical protein